MRHADIRGYPQTWNWNVFFSLPISNYLWLVFSLLFFTRFFLFLPFWIWSRWLPCAVECKCSGRFGTKCRCRRHLRFLFLSFFFFSFSAPLLVVQWHPRVHRPWELTSLPQVSLPPTFLSGSGRDGCLAPSNAIYHHYRRKLKLEFKQVHCNKSTNLTHRSRYRSRAN